MSFPWLASGAILIFRNGATLKTIAHEGNVNLSDCYLVDASLDFDGECRIKLERCDWIGNYRKLALFRTALNVYGQSLTVTDCQFSTRYARAIDVEDCDFFLTGSRFTRCGHANLNGGAVAYSYDGDLGFNSPLIENCRFDRCIGALGGAIYFDDKVKGVKKCEFVACESRGLRGGQGGDIAVYAERATGRALTDCVFRET